jgi:DNA-binding IclR family transcriptional regulator
MPCVSPEGKPTGTGVKTLQAVDEGADTPEKVAQATGQPMFKVRSGLRDLVNAGFLELKGGKYSLTETAQDAI